MQLYREEENNMKKRVLTAVLAAALVTGTCAATVSAKEEKTYTIGICQLVQHDALDAATKGFEDAITEKTKAIVPVHYAGVACEMDTIMDIAKRHNLKVVEDAAQGVSAYYKGKALGTIGDFGCYSFHETKNYTMGEGGALLFQDENYLEKAEILREKGTNRSKFFRGQIDKYTWIDYGSSYLPSDMNAAYLLAELEEHEKIDRKRMAIYNYYHEQLRPLAEAGKIEQPVVPEGCVHNAHMYFIKARNLEVRTKLIKCFPRRGQIHNKRERAPDASADVLRPV